MWCMQLDKTVITTREFQIFIEDANTYEQSSSTLLRDPHWITPSFDYFPGSSDSMKSIEITRQKRDIYFQESNVMKILWSRTGKMIFQRIDGVYIWLHSQIGYEEQSNEIVKELNYSSGSSIW
jgi:hypothetical protein